MLMIYGLSSACNTTYDIDILPEDSQDQDQDFDEDYGDLWTSEDSIDLLLPESPEDSDTSSSPSEPSEPSVSPKALSSTSGDKKKPSLEKSTDTKKEPKKRISLNFQGERASSVTPVRQQLSMGRSKVVSVEIKNKKNTSGSGHFLEKKDSKKSVSQEEYDRRKEILERAGLWGKDFSSLSTTPSEASTARSGATHSPAAGSFFGGASTANPSNPSSSHPLTEGPTFSKPSTVSSSIRGSSGLRSSIGSSSGIHSSAKNSSVENPPFGRSSTSNPSEESSSATRSPVGSSSSIHSSAKNLSTTGSSIKNSSVGNSSSDHRASSIASSSSSLAPLESKASTPQYSKESTTTTTSKSSGVSSQRTPSGLGRKPQDSSKNTKEGASGGHSLGGGRTSGRKGTLHPKAQERRQRQEELKILKKEENLHRLSSLSNFDHGNPWGQKPSQDEPTHIELQTISSGTSLNSVASPKVHEAAFAPSSNPSSSGEQKDNKNQSPTQSSAQLQVQQQVQPQESPSITTSSSTPSSTPSSFTFERYAVTKSNKEFEKELKKRQEKERQEEAAREILRREQERREQERRDQERRDQERRQGERQHRPRQEGGFRERSQNQGGSQNSFQGSSHGQHGHGQGSSFSGSSSWRQTQGSSQGHQEGSLRDPRGPRGEGVGNRRPRSTMTLSRQPGSNSGVGGTSSGSRESLGRGERDIQREKTEGRFEGGRYHGPRDRSSTPSSSEGGRRDFREPRGDFRPSGSGESRPSFGPRQGSSRSSGATSGSGAGFSRSPSSPSGSRGFSSRFGEDHQGSKEGTSSSYESLDFPSANLQEGGFKAYDDGPKKANFGDDWMKKEGPTRKRQDFRKKQSPEELEKERLEQQNRSRERYGQGQRFMTFEERELEQQNIMGLKKLKKNKRKAEKNKILLTGTVVLQQSMSPKDLALLLNRKEDVIKKTMKKLNIVSDNSHRDLEEDMAELVALELGFQVKRQGDPRFDFSWWSMDLDENTAVSRPPVVTVMGHVDHGKTSLLDALRHTDVAKGEAGGITQHIGAYQVTLPSGRHITFIDTPGHQAFTAMRARGAKVTDIVILVVAADEGINAQTLEAIQHVKNAQLPLIVAINKIDKPGSRPDYVRERLLEHEIVTEKLGGTTQDVEISALKKINLDILEESIIVQGDILELKTNEKRRARGVVLETYVRKGHGITASVLIQEGTLKKGDIFVIGNHSGKVRLMLNDKGQQVTEALPSQPVEIVGFSEKPESGDLLTVAPSESQARDFLNKQKEWTMLKEAKEEVQSLTVKDLIANLKPASVREYSLILKADTQGSLEGLLHEIDKIRHEEISLKIIDKDVGPVNEGDALLAKNTEAFIIAFNTSVLPEAKKIIDKENVKFLQHKIIYRVTEELKEILGSLLTPIFTEEWLGRAEVIQVFQVKKSLNIAGCSVKEGILRRGENVRVTRKGKIIYEGLIRSLRYQKDDVKERSMGQECGVIFDNFEDMDLGDELECFSKKFQKRTID